MYIGDKSFPSNLETYKNLWLLVMGVWLVIDASTLVLELVRIVKLMDDG